MTIAESRNNAKEFVKATLCLLIKDKKILLAMKKRGFGKGKWNGVGGKLNDGEGAYDAMVRETLEEIGVRVKSSKKVAELVFYNYDGSGRESANMKVDAYVATSWEGDPVESEEMAPKWFSTSEIPYEEMWADDVYWLPKVLEGKRVRFYALFSGGENIEEHLLEYD
jgi:8-oxo-dGTP pyrophosphatase MutT (NUDIX family)